MTEKPETLMIADEIETHVLFGSGSTISRTLLEKTVTTLRSQHAEIERLRDELKEDVGVIAVWRGRTERAEAENERLQEALKVCLSHWLDDAAPDELQENVLLFKELCDWNAALRQEEKT